MEYSRDICRPLLSLPALPSPPIQNNFKAALAPQGGIWAKPEVPGCLSDSGLASPSALPRLRLIFPNLHHRLAVTQGLADGDAALMNSTVSPSKSRWRATRLEPPSFAQMPQSLGHPYQHHPLQVPEVLQCLVPAG